MTREDAMSEIEENIIKYMKKYPNHVGNADFWEGFYACRNVVLQLDNEYSPKEQEPCEDEEQIDYHDDFATALRKIHDYEERQNDKKCGSCKLIGTDSCYMVCGGSKSLYKPKQKSEPCDDVVSRQAVLEILKDKWNIFSDANDAIQESIDTIEALRPVIPQERTGKWVEIVKEHKCYARDDTYTTTEYHCSECGSEPFVNEDGFYELSNYCPNCGARMESEQNE